MVRCAVLVPPKQLGLAPGLMLPAGMTALGVITICLSLLVVLQSGQVPIARMTALDTRHTGRDRQSVSLPVRGLLLGPFPARERQPAPVG